MLEDFKPGPLDLYRTKSSFDWKKFKVFLDTEELIKFENEIIEELKEYPDYRNGSQAKSLDELRRVSLRQSMIYRKIESLKVQNLLSNLRKPQKANRLMMQINANAAIKYIMSYYIFNTTIQSMGTNRHLKFVEDCDDGKIMGCFCLTEIGHGSDTKSMRTTATYDEKSKVFVLNSPDFKAAKCWAGGLGQCASFALVFAQLIVREEKKGLHCFVVPIRDPKTLKPYPGVIVGDMGEKIGLNGIDNGFVMFKNYPIPRENLLNRIGDVSENGEYTTPIRDPTKRHGASLGNLSVGRVTITNMAYAYGIKGLTIAIRYAAVRRQFGPDEKQEIPILEYQIHQHRLLPHLAAAFVLRIFTDYFEPCFFEFALDAMMNPKDNKLADRGVEIHAISSGCKPVACWTMMDALQECREACGGHGYLKCAGIGELRSNNDANCTYEGENHVLIQQTENWLLKFWPLVLNGSKVSSPLKSVDFLMSAKNILRSKLNAINVEQLCSPGVLLNIYAWLVCYLLRESHEKLIKNMENDRNQFWTKANSQVYFARNLAVAFIQHFFLERMLVIINQAPDEHIKRVLQRLFALYALTNVEKHHLGTLYRGGFFTSELPAGLIQDSIIKLCGDLKDDAVSLIDVVAPPDFAMNSVLGASDGQVYQRLETEILHSTYGMGRPSWWKDVTDWQSYVFRSKL